MTGIPQLPFHMAIDTVVMAILFAVAWIDWHERRIPNSTLLMLLGCTVFQFAAVRMSLVEGLSPWDLAMNLSVAAVLFVPAYGVGLLGAGDVKLFGVLALLWPSEVYWQAFAIGTLGLVLLCLIIDRVRRLGNHFAVETAPVHATVLMDSLRTRGIPAGTAMALGAFITLI